VPNKVFQGMAAGCAIVTSDTAAQRALLGDSVRYVAPGDPEALADAVAALASARTEVSRLATDGRALANEKYTSVAIGRDLVRRVREVAR
jgi:glycosyltransferase involved in cell wall biosynthesis